MFSSDHEVADYAIEIEDQLEIDMNLSDMFSNDLSNYFSFTYNSSKHSKSKKDCITFYFETNEGSCELVIVDPNTENEEFYYNEALDSHIEKNWFDDYKSISLIR